MGRLTVPASGVVYVDANAVIYRVERIEPYLTAAAPLWDAVDAGRARVATSELTLLEALVKPFRDGNAALAALYRQVLLGTIGVTPLPLTRAVLETAARLRRPPGEDARRPPRRKRLDRRVQPLCDERRRLPPDHGG
jgi:hypothetical protein